jgi:hypothetical protein
MIIIVRQACIDGLLVSLTVFISGRSKATWALVVSPWLHIE